MRMPSLEAHHALVIVDVQNDFCPGGALPSRGCKTMVEELNRWIAAAEEAGSRVVASRDWHPPGHISFHERGGPWPAHCVQESWGAQFHPDLQLPPDVKVVNKGTDPDKDNYSALEDTGLVDWLRAEGVDGIWVGGVAQEVCVRATVLDALKAGFQVHVIARATSPVDEASGRQALEEMAAAGAIMH